jgi:hypothetical protein
MASKRRIKRKSCVGKIRHASSNDARQALRKTVRYDEVHQPMNVYQCQFCGGFHIGHRNLKSQGA